MFSIIDAGKNISSHTGPYNGVLRYHLCVITNKKNPEKCFLVVNNIKYYWREGYDVLFDDFMPHYINNDTDSTRVVLVLDIKKKFNNKFINYLNSFILLVADNNITKKDIIYKTNSTIL
jgi:aspartyl/asparaginyl beta-hydroxylase (cupin superfamily)